MKFKIFLGILFIFFIAFSLYNPVFAFQPESSSSTYSFNEYYDNQLKESQADKLWNQLPSETKQNLKNIGISSLSWENMLNLSYEKVFSEIKNIITEQSKPQFSIFAQVLGVILLCALVNGANLSLNRQPLSEVMNLVAILCLCVMVVTPVVSCIENTDKAIKAASVFMLCYIPIMAGIMIALGQTFSAVSYNVTMISVSEIISQIASNFLIPLLNIFLSFSIVSGLSPRLNFKSLCNTLMKIIKWVLATVMTVFTTLLTLQNIVSSSADSASFKAVKLALSSFVPVVGSALGDAYGTIQASLKILKSGVGAFAILAGAFTFIPSIFECILWIITLNICACACDMFSLSRISDLLHCILKVLGLMIAILLCCIALLTVSTLLILNMGGMT